MSKIKIIRNKNAIEFLKINSIILRKNATFNNLILGIPLEAVKGLIDDKDTIYLTIYQGDKIVGQAVNRDESRNLLISQMPKNVIDDVISFFYNIRKKFRGVYGRKDLCEEAAKKLTNLSTKRLSLQDHNGVYELKNLNMPDISNLKLCDQKSAPEDLLTEWAYLFIKECQLHTKMDQKSLARDYLKRQQKTQGFRVLKNRSNEIVSMAAIHRQIDDIATISMVYTPIPHRKKGYGKKVTALLTQELLSNGFSICNLFTDMRNPTSNKIYQEIGYKLIGEVVSYEFVS